LRFPPRAFPLPVPFFYELSAALFPASPVLAVKPFSFSSSYAYSKYLSFSPIVRMVRGMCSVVSGGEIYSGK
jgi:hypothetical protein